MAKLSFVRGAITGKLGEFVGSKWKGINYIRTWSKPANPRTEGQISVRKIFKSLSLFASALYSLDLLELIPVAAKMTERNSVFKANGVMFEDKVFTPNTMQVAPANTRANLDSLSATVTAGKLAVNAIVNCLDKIVSGSLYAVAYDFVTGLTAGVAEAVIVDGVAQLTANLVIPSDFDFSDNEQKANCRVYVFAAGEDFDGKMLISQTFSTGIA